VLDEKALVVLEGGPVRVVLVKVNLLGCGGWGDGGIITTPSRPSKSKEKKKNRNPTSVKKKKKKKEKKKRKKKTFDAITRPERRLVVLVRAPQLRVLDRQDHKPRRVRHQQRLGRVNGCNNEKQNPKE
jgi:hypothetical protein